VVQVAADGSLKGLDELDPQSDKQARDGGAILIAQLLGLLLTFIGEGLTLRLVQDVWPEAAFNGRVSEKEESLSTASKVKINKLPTGVPGLDEILAAVCRNFLLISSRAPREAARPRWRTKSYSPTRRRSARRSISPSSANPPSKCCATSNSTRSLTKPVKHAVRFINLSQVVLEKDLDAVLEEITKEVEKASPASW